MSGVLGPNRLTVPLLSSGRMLRVILEAAVHALRASCLRRRSTELSQSQFFHVPLTPPMTCQCLVGVGRVAEAVVDVR